MARRAAVSQALVSRIERGNADGVTVATLRRLLAAVDADLWLQVRWRGGELDRLLDEGHASLTGDTVQLLSAHGWEVRVEVSFSTYGERGSIDLLAWHPPTRTLAVGEVKTEITSVEETLRTHDMKVRVGARIARERFGWATASVDAPVRAAPHDVDLSSACRPTRRSLLARPTRSAAGALRTWLRSPGAETRLPDLPGHRRPARVVSVNDADEAGSTSRI